MPVRTPNNPIPPAILMAQFKIILPGYPTANTQLAVASSSGTGVENIYIRDRYGLMSTGSYPAVNLRMGAQTRSRISRTTFAATVDVWVEYFDKWDQTTTTLEQISRNIGDDLERMAANLETNETLTNGGFAYTVALPVMVMSDDHPFMESLGAEEIPFRTLKVTCHVLPYDALS